MKIALRPQELSYPGWVFDNWFGDPSVINCSWKRDDIYRPDTDKFVYLEINVSIMGMDREAAINAVFDCIGKLEMHERIEGFKVNGQRAFDPHPNGRFDPSFTPGPLLEAAR